MRYTITEGPNKGKRINIPDAQIQRLERDCDTDLNGAISIYLSDEGLLVDPIVAEYTEKAKAAGTNVKNQADRKERKAPVRKPDVIKREFIDQMALVIEGDFKCENVEITNPERMIAFEFAGEKFELTLTKKRKPKE